MLRVGLAAIVGAVLVLTSGCDTSQDDDVEPRRAQVSAGLAELYAGSDPAPEVREEGACFAEALLGRRSLEQLVEVGVIGDDGVVLDVPPVLDRPSAEAWVDAQDACTDFAAVSARAALAQTDGRLDQAAYRACLEGAIDTAETRQALVDALTGRYGSPATTRLDEAQAGCRAEALPDG